MTCLPCHPWMSKAGAEFAFKAANTENAEYIGKTEGEAGTGSTNGQSALQKFWLQPT